MKVLRIRKEHAEKLADRLLRKRLKLAFVDREEEVEKLRGKKVDVVFLLEEKK